jgi:hypothetical protein
VPCHKGGSSWLLRNVSSHVQTSQYCILWDCIGIKTSVDSALTNKCMPLQLSVHEIMVCIGRLFGCIALSMLKDIYNSDQPFLGRKRELGMSERKFLCHSDFACDLHT